MVDDWQYYNHCLIPTIAPHESIDPEKLNSYSFWKSRGGIALFARWTEDFDCGYETEWWYVIKDTPFNIMDLKSKRRYEINKGQKNFSVQRIHTINFQDELYKVQIAAVAAYPQKYRPKVDEIQFKKKLINWNTEIVYGAFYHENKTLCGYAYLKERNGYLEFSVLKTNPNYEKYGINAAIINQIIHDYNDKIGKGFYICDGSRTIHHETAFQDYLEKYFGFRKAYCKLKIRYRFIFGLIVKLLFPFRKRIGNKFKFTMQISAVLKMEEIRRSFI